MRAGGRIIECYDGDWIGDMELSEWSSNQGLKNTKAGLISLESGIIDIVNCDYASRPGKCLFPNNTPNRRILD